MPAVWSFQLALRARGLGSAWTTLHLDRAADAAALLGIPDGVTQVALLPVAYTLGTDFKPAPASRSPSARTGTAGARRRPRPSARRWRRRGGRPAPGGPCGPRAGRRRRRARRRRARRRSAAARAPSGAPERADPGQPGELGVAAEEQVAQRPPGQVRRRDALADVAAGPGQAGRGVGARRPASSRAARPARRATRRRSRRRAAAGNSSRSRAAQRVLRARVERRPRGRCRAEAVRQAAPADGDPPVGRALEVDVAPAPVEQRLRAAPADLAPRRPARAARWRSSRWSSARASRRRPGSRAV